MEHIVLVGEHNLIIRSASTRLMEWISTYFQVSKIFTVTPEIDISIELIDGYGSPFIDYHVDIHTDSGGIYYRRSDYLIEASSDYCEARIFVHDLLALKHALTNLYSAFIVQNHWGLLIHSSCIDNYGKAHLFAGRSGAGKSTVTRLSQPRPILSDEASLIKITGNDFRVFDSPFRSENNTPYGLNSCPLSSIFLLIQSNVVRTHPLKKADALIELLDKVFYWHHDSAETAKLLQMCRRLVEHIPVYEMLFQKNDSFWELIS